MEQSQDFRRASFSTRRRLSAVGPRPSALSRISAVFSATVGVVVREPRKQVGIGAGAYPDEAAGSAAQQARARMAAAASRRAI
jgi:hypothetical protein